MRLYAKLAAIVLIAVAVQWALKRGPVAGSEAWFAARCHLAHVTKDREWNECLVEEAMDFRCCAQGVPINAAAASN